MASIRSVLSASLVAGSVLVAACHTDSTGPGNLNYTSIVAGVVTTVVVPTYDSLGARSARMASAIAALAANPTDSALHTAQTIWKSARANFEFNEAFEFGPIETLGVDPAVDTWPIDEAGIDAIIASSDTLTPTFIDGLTTTLKGFHGVEYILFGINGSTTAASLTPRQLQYLVAASQDVANETALLVTAWSPSGGNYIGAVLTAGQPSSPYATTSGPREDLVSQMISQPGQIAYKFTQPLATDSSIYEESLYSDNTLGDIESNIAGVAAVYYGGDAASPGHGLGALVAAKDPTLDATVRSELATATAAIAAIQPTFNIALHQDPSALQAAAQATLTLQTTMINLVGPLLGNGNPGPLGPQPDND
jgi:putative iron-regulated protein